jgi:hypothetical protein
MAKTVPTMAKRAPVVESDFRWWPQVTTATDTEVAAIHLRQQNVKAIIKPHRSLNKPSKYGIMRIHMAHGKCGPKKPSFMWTNSTNFHPYPYLFSNRKKDKGTGKRQGEVAERTQKEKAPHLSRGKHRS